ncbi:MAG: toll/interleukin-1 receptor domain-containing protein, partial [Hyphomicrobiaceae bacterium]
MAGGIFINYRRQDSRPWAGRLHDRLDANLPNELFMDVNTIAPGDDFIAAIHRALEKCDVLLAVIGPGWLNIQNDSRTGRRIDSPGDFVRLELEEALSRDLFIVPVLVDDAKMPAEEELPDSLKPLARRHAVTLTHEKWDTDTERLIGAIRNGLVSVAQRRAEEKRRREAEHRQAEAEARRNAAPVLQDLAEALQLRSAPGAVLGIGT